MIFINTKLNLLNFTLTVIRDLSDTLCFFHIWLSIIRAREVIF